MDGVYDWTVKPTVNNLAFDMPIQKVEVKPSEEKYENVRKKKEDAMD